MTRRQLGPGPALREALADRPPAQRRPPWLPEDPAVAVARRRTALLEAALPGLQARAEKLEEVDSDELQETAGFARTLRDDPVATVDRTVRAALAELAAWESDLAALAAELVAADPQTPLDPAIAERGRVLDEQLQQARATLLDAIAEYHHGGHGPRLGPRPW